MLKSISITLAGILIWWIFVVFAGLSGLWMEPLAPANQNQVFVERATAVIQSNEPANVALIMLEEGEVAHEYYSESLETIEADTVFLTASFSKWIAATAVMKLVEEEKLNLDTPVNELLSLWQIPNSAYDLDKVTVRRLLSHTSGLTDGLGFGEYLAEEEVPALPEQLANPRASNNREASISLGVEPGSEWRYSGGGYLILELLVEEVTGLSFADYVNQAILEPLEMQRSGYEFIGDVSNNAGSYQRKGIAGELYRYGSNAATGFVSSAADLTNFVRAQSSDQNIPGWLSPETIKAMRQPHGSTLGLDIWGLGTILYAPTASGDFVFGHDGANDPAINTAVRVNPDNGDGIIVLATGHPSIATNIGSAWVFWQTGTPDALDSDTVFNSMLRPGLIGTVAILVLLGLLMLRRRVG